MNPSADPAAVCVCCVCCAFATNTWSGFASYVVRETQLSSFSGRCKVPLLPQAALPKANKKPGLAMVTDPSRGEGVGRSDESSFRNEQGCFCAKFRVLRLIGLALGPGLNWPSGWPSCPGQRPFHCHEQPPRRGTTLLDGQRSRGRPHLACWADIAAGRRPKQRCSTAAPRGGAPTRRRPNKKTATATATPS